MRRLHHGQVLVVATPGCGLASQCAGRRGTEAHRLDAGSDEEMIEFLRDGRDDPLATLIDEMPAHAHDEVSSCAWPCGGQVADFEDLLAPRRHVRMAAQQRFDRDTEISLEEESFLRRTPVTRSGHDAGFASQADQRRREVEHHSLVAEGIDTADQGLGVTPACRGLVVDGKA
jgi:hypothetical protein